MRFSRDTAAVALLLLTAGLAVLGVWFHYGLTAEYGDVTDSALEGWVSAFRGGIGGLALVVVGIAAVAAFAVSTRRWMRLAAALLPALMTVGMLAVTPAALSEKLDVQYAETPQCLWREGAGRGPGVRAAQASQEAFDSVDHVGHFSGGGSSGVGGCDRPFVLLEDVDVLEHYRAALPPAGWRVVEDDGDRLRAERGRMAFVVIDCEGEGVVWAGKATDPVRVRCDRSSV